MMKPELQDVFMAEGRRLLALMRRGLSGVDGAPPLPELYRWAHMLKGNAKLAGFPELELVAGPLADYLRLAKRGGGELAAEQSATVSEALEACATILEGREAARLPALLRRLRGAERPPDPGAAGGAALKLLLVEDSDLQAEVVRQSLARLEGAGAALERADRLSRGLERLAEGGVDAVILDLDLPDSRGLHGLKEVSKLAPEVPVVILTAVDDEAMATAALREGAQDYLVKGRIGADALPRAVRFAVERKRVERSLRKARADLERRVSERTSELRHANNELALFAAAASHELRQPLRKIIAWGDLLKETCAATLGEQSFNPLHEMQQGARRLGDIIDGLRELTRVSTQARPLEPVELDAVLGDAARETAALFARAGGRLAVERLPAIRGDRAQIRRLFESLFENALKYRAAERPLLVAVRARPRGAVVEIDVTDNGIGFEQKYAERIFEPFQRLHGPGTYEGAGLGLAISRRIAARHGGALSARGEPGKGSTFTVTLPLAEPVR